jgi:outer membrane murein-binding lipoprotein Lpp
VGHDQIRALLQAYAAGELGAVEAEVVRAHLATGCGECLRDLFGRPVGARRADEPRRGGARGSGGLGPGAAVVALALVAGALGAWAVTQWRVVGDLHGREGRLRAEVERLASRIAEAERQSAALRTDGERLDRDLAAAHRETARQEEAARAATAAESELTTELERAKERIGTLARGVARRDAEIERLLAGIGEERALHELAATPGVRMLPLRPVAPFDHTRGHVLWHPGRPTLVFYAFDLPPPPVGASYRVRLTLGDGSLADGLTVRPGPRGDVAATMRLEETGEGLRAVELVQEPAARPVLIGLTR